MTGLSATLWRDAIIVAAMVSVVGMNCLGIQCASAQIAPDYAALMAAPDRRTATVGPTSAAIRCRFLRSPVCGRA
jgi:hypothetical protein